MSDDRPLKKIGDLRKVIKHLGWKCHLDGRVVRAWRIDAFNKPMKSIFIASANKSDNLRAVHDAVCFLDRHITSNACEFIGC